MKHTVHQIDRQLEFVAEEIDFLRDGAQMLERDGFGYESRRYYAAIAQLTQAKNALDSRMKDAAEEQSREPSG